MLADPTGRRWYDMIQEGGQSGVRAAVEIVQGLTQGTMPDALAVLPGNRCNEKASEVAALDHPNSLRIGLKNAVNP
jgi:hypothetical protein